MDRIIEKIKTPEELHDYFSKLKGPGAAEHIIAISEKIITSDNDQKMKHICKANIVSASTEKLGKALSAAKGIILWNSDKNKVTEGFEILKSIAKAPKNGKKDNGKLVKQTLSEIYKGTHNPFKKDSCDALAVELGYEPLKKQTALKSMINRFMR